MELKQASLGLALAGLGVSFVVSSGCSKAAASGTTIPAAPVDLTVYKDDFGMIHELRPVDLKPGSNQIQIANVSGMLDPNSVMFEAPEGARVVSTTYEMGAGNDATVIKRLAGKEVEFIWASNDGREGQRIKGTLEPTEGGFLLRVGDKVYVNPAGTLVAPGDVSTLPGLAARIESTQASQKDLGVSYLTRGLSWSADYVAHLDTEAGTLSLECWASVTNRTGIPFKDAKVTFVAGNPNRATRTVEMQRDMDSSKTSVPADGGRRISSYNGIAVPEAVGELYQYKPKDRANIGLDQINRVRMFDASAVPVKLDYSIRLPDLSAWGTESGPRQNAQLAISFKNKKEAGLGLPMPSGAIRIYQRDGSDDRYTGADTLQDLAVDSPTSLTLTKVFDVSAEPKVLKVQRLDKHTVRKTVQVLLRNAKGRDVEVRLVDSIYERWSVSAGPKPEKLDASTAQWKVLVPSKGEKTLLVTFDLKS